MGLVCYDCEVWHRTVFCTHNPSVECEFHNETCNNAKEGDTKCESCECAEIPGVGLCVACYVGT